MKKQFVVLGLGSFGASVAVTLQQLGCDVVAVDQDMERIEDVADRVTYAGLYRETLSRKTKTNKQKIQ